MCYKTYPPWFKYCFCVCLTLAIIRSNAAYHQKNFVWNVKTFIQENVFQNAVSKMAAILFWPRCESLASFAMWLGGIDA